jgi:hypothetical protein
LEVLSFRYDLLRKRKGDFGEMSEMHGPINTAVIRPHHDLQGCRQASREHNTVHGSELVKHQRRTWKTPEVLYMGGRRRFASRVVTEIEDICWSTRYGSE